MVTVFSVFVLILLRVAKLPVSSYNTGNCLDLDLNFCEMQ